MANKKDCEVCMKMMKEKHKRDRFFKIGFWVLLVLLIVMCVLYFGTGEMITTTEVNNNADVVIENDGANNDNNVNINQG